MNPDNQENNFQYKHLYPISKELDEIGKLIVDSAYTVHKN
jgi:hypothetical protein